MHCIYNTAAYKRGHVTHIKNTGSYCREYTVKTVLRIGDYLIEKPIILIFQNFAEIDKTETRPHFLVSRTTVDSAGFSYLHDMKTLMVLCYL